MKKLVVMIGVLLVIMLIILGLNPTVIYTSNEGYLVPSSAKIASSMSQSQNANVDLQYVDADGMIYSSFLQDYEFESKTAIDLSYPMFTNGGATVQFFSEEFWLIAADFTLLTTYDGLYLTDGNTYNQDLTLADGDEFLLVAVGDGLYMNAQSAVFSTVLGDVTIPANSIIQFTSTSVNFYEYKDGSLAYTSIEEMFEAKITIGEHTYYYSDFLNALGIFEASINGADDLSDLEDIRDEMQDALQEDDDDDDSSGDSTSGAAASTTLGDDLFETLGADAGAGDATSDEQQEGDGAIVDSDIEEESELDGTQSGGSSGDGDAGDDGGASGDSGSSDSSSGGDSDYVGGEEGDGEYGEGGTGTGGGAEIPFQVPTAEIENLEAWVYALSGDLVVSDPSAALSKGVSLTVYEKDNGDGTGSSAKLRRTLYSSQTFTLSGIEPGKDYYIQFSYTYTYETTNEEGEEIYTSKTVVSELYKVTTQTIEAGDLQTISLTYDAEFAAYSDRLSFQNFATTNLSDYDATLDTWENFKLNTLPYFSKLVITLDDGDSSTEDVVVTITSATLTKATAEGGMDYTSAAKSLLSNTTYTYSMVAYDKYGNVLPLEVNGADYSTYEGTVYTAKAMPSVSIEEVSNITDYLTLKVTVDDVNGALADDAILKLFTVDTSSAYASLSGTWADGTSLVSVVEDGTTYLALENATDGAEYEFTIDSLAFARTYTFTVYGDYDPQPDGVDPSLYYVAPLTNQLFGTAKSYTASMTSGSLYIEIDETQVNATGASIDFSISNKSTVEVLSLVDEFRITITDSNTKEVIAVTLEESVWSKVGIGDAVIDGEDGETYTYDSTTGTALLYEEGDIKVELVGTELELLSGNFWEILLATQTFDDEGNVASTSSAAAEIRVTMADGSLNTATEYTLNFQPVVVKSGVEYTVPAILEQYDFDTKKAAPTVIMDDAFIANDVIEFINFDFVDTDGAIVGTGEVAIQVYYGTTLLQKTSVFVSDAAQNVRFEGLTSGLVYTIKIIALSYNDQTVNAGFQSNYTLETYEITAGSDITATITLNSLEYTYDARQTVLSVSGSTIYDEMEAAKDENGGSLTNGLGTAYPNWSTRSNAQDDVYSPFYEITTDLDLDPDNDGENANVLSLSYTPDVYNTNNYSNFEIIFYDSSKSQISYSSMSYIYGATLTVLIPDSATYVRFLFSDVNYLTTNGFEVNAYTIDPSIDGDLIASFSSSSAYADGITMNSKYVEGADYSFVEGYVYSSNSVDTAYISSGYTALYQLAVTPGDVYFSTSGNPYGEQALLYNSQGELVGYERSLRSGGLFVIPENVYYITFSVYNYTNYNLYYLCGVEDGAQYVLDADVDVYDKKGSLLDDDEKSTVQLIVEKSTVINTDAAGGVDTYEVVEFADGEESKWIEMFADLETGEYTGGCDYDDLLDPNCSYRLSVTAVYAGATITLATQTVETDGALMMINNVGDLGKIYTYPYANFLVTADIETSTGYDITFYGTIDFDGHTITQTGTSQYVINAIGTSGVVKNVVYQNTSGYIRAFIYNNFGLMENIMVKTEGSVYSINTSYGGYIVNSNQGTVNNFIIELNGNVYLEHNYASVAVRANYGTVSNGYIYTTGGSAFYVTDGEATNIGIVSSYSWSYATIENVYVVGDLYVARNEDGNLSSAWILSPNAQFGAVNDCYHVGDFYEYTGSYSGEQYLSTVRVFNNGSYYNDAENIWSFSNATYELSGAADNTLFGEVSMLADVDWQKDVLGDAFNIDSSVSMGYYPRLSLPICMEKHQAYNVLPSAIQSTTPTVMMDQYTDGTEIYNTQAMITLRLENPSEYPITAVVIEGLSVTVSAQGMQDDGLYDVYLSVVVDPNDPEYLSEYDVVSITYSNGGMNYTTTSEYTTQNFAFYKTVANTDDWAAINNNMTWNYRLTADIAFTSTSSVASMMINGSTSSMTASTSFTGTIDGGKYDNYGNLISYYTVSGISIMGVERPYVIYYLNGGTIKNLNITDLTLTGLSTPSSEQYTGFIRYVSNYGVMENIHMNGVTIESSARMGALAGWVNTGYVSDCSVTDVSITLKNAKYTVYVGGMMGGFGDRGYIQNCYVKDVDISLTGVSASGGIGGLAGYVTHVNILNCYTQGSITTDAKIIGGAVGRAESNYGWIKNVITDVDIETISGSVGGIVGQNNARLQSNFAIGDIIASDNNVHRLTGMRDISESYVYYGFAYENQMVNTLTSTDNDDARYLYSGTELRKISAWVDEMSFGDQWDYSVLADGYLPMLYYKGTTTLLPGQEGEDALVLPGGETITIDVNAAGIIYTGSTVDYYLVDIRVTDEAYETQEELIAAVKAGMPTAPTTTDVTTGDSTDDTTGDGTDDTVDDTTGDTADDIEPIYLNIVGMSMEESDYAYDVTSVVEFKASTIGDKWYYSVNADGSDGVQILIYTTTFTNAYDTYKLQVTSGSGVQSAIIDYGESLYFIVNDITDWNDYMLSGHSNTSENFKINGEVDFSVASTALQTDLILGNLLGTSNNASFTNLTYTTYTAETGATNGNWITSCKSITGIDFIDFTADFTVTAAYQQAGTFIAYAAGDLQDITIDTMQITTSNSNTAAGSIALIYELTGNAYDITVTGVTLTQKQDGTSTTGRNYAGSIAAYTYGTCDSVTGDNITVSAPYLNNTGALFGYMDGNASVGGDLVTNHIYLHDSTVTGYTNVGGVAGEMQDMVAITNVLVEDVSVNAMGSAGGISYRFESSSIYSSYNSSNLTVRNSSVISTQVSTNTTYTYTTGGLFGSAMYNTAWYDMTAENVWVEGYGRVGGIAGYSDRYFRNIQVIDCTIIQHSDISSSMDNKTCAGGVFGIWIMDSTTVNYDWVVRGTTVTADYNAGGLIGFINEDDCTTIYNAYVAEDVTVTATIDNAGGAFGYAEEFRLKDTVLGATVTAMGSNAGGMIGYLTSEQTYQHSIGVYVGGTVSAANNAGGLIGYVTADVTLNSTKLTGAIITADVNSGSEVDPFANFEDLTTSYSSGNIGVWDNMLINGQTAGSIYREVTADADADASLTPMKSGLAFLTATGSAVATATTEADDFLQKETYTAYSFSQIEDTYLVVDAQTVTSNEITTIENNIYAPFVLNYTSDSSASTTLQNSDSYLITDTITWDASANEYIKNYTTEDSSVGVLRPTTGERTGATVVYVSGVDSINIETSQASVIFSMTDSTGKAVALTEGALNATVVTDVIDSEGTTLAATGGTLTNNGDDTYTYTFASEELYGANYHAITLGFDFASQSSITIGTESTAVTYTGTDLARTVMTYSNSSSSANYWYYIGTDGYLYYGADSTTNPNMVEVDDTEISGIVHLWQGKALASDGTVYQDNGTSWAVVTETVTSYITEPVLDSYEQPTYDEYNNPITQEVPVETTQNYTHLATGAIQSTASPIFSTSLYNIYYNFSLSGEGAYLGYRAYTLNGVTYAVFTAQSALYDGYILASQGNYNYFVLLSTETDTLTSYLTPVSTTSDFVNSDIAQMSNSFSYFGSMAVIRYQDGSVKVWNYTTGNVTVSIEASSGEPGTNEINGLNLVSGINTTSGDSLSGGSSAATSDGIVSRMASFASTYTNSLFSWGSVTTEEEDVSTVPADDSYQNSIATMASYTQSNSTAADTTSSDTGDAGQSDETAADTNLSGEQGSSEADGIGGGDDISASAEDVTALTNAESGTANVDGDNTDASDELANTTSDEALGDADTTVGTDVDAENAEETLDGTGNASGTATTTTGTASAQTDAVSAVDGTSTDAEYTIAYNPYTGNYEVYATEEIANGTQSVQSITAEMITISTDSQLTAGDMAAVDDTFAVRVFSSSVLSSDERNGFVLLSIIVLAGVAVVMVLHIKYKKR